MEEVNLQLQLHSIYICN